MDWASSCHLLSLESRLWEHIQGLHGWRTLQAAKFGYGYRKITALLRRAHKINHKYVQRIIQREGLQCRVRVKKHRATGQPAYLAEHLLKRQFKAEPPCRYYVLRLAEKCCTCRVSWTCLMERLWHTVYLANKTQGLYWTHSISSRSSRYDAP
ncbi:hypothetical protein C1T20_03875 [Paenibacillus polymyxa]|nr:hypothetical protein C1T20_03875 [Paenibacillus polymyxa]